MKQKVTLLIFFIILIFCCSSCTFEHSHQFTEGKCECGEIDLDYVEPHEHKFIEGRCECGEIDPDYVEPHEHKFIEGKCECGETDPNYVAPHEHKFIEGKCECGEIDPDYKEIKYTITFVDYDNTIIKIIIINRGEHVSYPDDPVREGYIFEGWSHDLENI